MPFVVPCFGSQGKGNGIFLDRTVRNFIYRSLIFKAEAVTGGGGGQVKFKSSTGMGPGQVFGALHFHQPGRRALELEGAVALGV